MNIKAVQIPNSNAAKLFQAKLLITYRKLDFINFYLTLSNYSNPTRPYFAQNKRKKNRRPIVLNREVNFRTPMNGIPFKLFEI